MISIIFLYLLSATNLSTLLILFLIFCLSGDIFNSMKDEHNEVITLSGFMFVIAHILLIAYLIINSVFSFYGILISMFILMPLNIYMLLRLKKDITVSLISFILVSIYILLVTMTVSITFMHLFTCHSIYSIIFSIGIFLFYISDVLLLYLTMILKSKYAHIFVWLTYAPGIWLMILSQIIK
jgi:hypothetical protein